VEVVLEQGGATKCVADWSWIDETPLRTPAEAALQTGLRLAELLEAAGQRARHPGVLPALAEWWIRSFGSNGALADFRQRPLEAWQQELRSIRGVSWELADRILLFAGGLAVYPLDRGSLRIAARHGWMDIATDYDDWQAFFVRGLREADVEIAAASSALSRLGREYCGRRPKCEECPLKPLLPARGPIALEADD
jgi:endonuclease-3 related protein